MSHIYPCFGRKDPADAPLTLALDAKGSQQAVRRLASLIGADHHVDALELFEVLVAGRCHRAPQGTHEV